MKVAIFRGDVLVYGDNNSVQDGQHKLESEVNAFLEGIEFADDNSKGVVRHVVQSMDSNNNLVISVFWEEVPKQRLHPMAALVDEYHDLLEKSRKL